MPAFPVGALLERIDDIADGPTRLISAASAHRGRVRILWTGAEREMNLRDSPFVRLVLFSGVPVGLYHTSGIRRGEVLESLGVGADGLSRYRIKVDGEEIVLAETQSRGSKRSENTQSNIRTRLFAIHTTCPTS